MQKRILFIIKNLYTMERLGIMQMAALARRQDWECDLLVADEQDYKSILLKKKSLNPDILAFSAMSPEFPALDQLARQLKEDSPCFILFGGPHATFFQDIIEADHIDAVAFGEGDLSFPEFLATFAGSGDYRNTRGMHFRDNGHIVRNPPAPLVSNLDDLPFPDRGLMIKGNELLRHNRSHIFMASRGCPNACTYCFNHRYNELFRDCGNILRRRSVDNFLAEMEATRAEYNTEFAYIDDDIFTLCSKEWLAEFAEKYPARVGIPFMCNVHVNFIDEDKIRLLKDAGCRYVCFGIECGDEDVARTLLRRTIRNDKIIELGRLLRKYGIRYMTQNLMALPVEHPLATDLQTLDLNIRCRPHYAVAHLFYPLPGTELARFSLENGFLPVDATDLPERTNSFSALTFPDTREKRRVERFHKLFGLTVSFPWLRPLIPVLIRLPLQGLYSLLFVCWYGFSMRFRLERTRKSFKEITFFLKSLGRSFSSFLKSPRSRAGEKP